MWWFYHVLLHSFSCLFFIMNKIIIWVTKFWKINKTLKLSRICKIMIKYCHFLSVFIDKSHNVFYTVHYYHWAPRNDVPYVINYSIFSKKISRIMLTTKYFLRLYPFIHSHIQLQLRNTESMAGNMNNFPLV